MKFIFWKSTFPAVDLAVQSILLATIAIFVMIFAERYGQDSEQFLVVTKLIIGMSIWQVFSAVMAVIARTRWGNQAKLFLILIILGLMLSMIPSTQWRLAGVNVVYGLSVVYYHVLTLIVCITPRKNSVSNRTAENVRLPNAPILWATGVIKYIDLSVQLLLISCWLYMVFGRHWPYGGGYVILVGGAVAISGWQLVSAIISVIGRTPFWQEKTSYLIALLICIFTSPIWLATYTLIGGLILTVVVLVYLILTIYYFSLTARWCFGVNSKAGKTN